MSATSDEDARCPTCGHSGPDTFSYLYDEGVTEAACGDDWHDTATTSGGSGT